MTSHLVEGETFPPNHKLDKRLSQTRDIETWVATSEITGEKVFVKVFTSPVSEADWLALTSRADAMKGLVHEHINTVTGHGSEPFQYLVEPYISDAHHYDPVTVDAWRSLKQLIDALMYAHQLDLAHGNLHPGNVLVDAEGNLHLCSFGLPPLSGDHNDYHSPQVRQGQTPDLADDVYSLGCFAYRALTGSDWRSDNQGTDAIAVPVPGTLEPLVTRMLSESAFERQLGLRDIRSAFASHFNESENSIESVHFSRPETAPGEPAIPSPVQTRQSREIPASTVAIGIAALVLIAVVLFTFLPGDREVKTSQPDQPAVATTTNQGPATANNAATPEQPALTPLQEAQLAYQKEEGEKLAKEILRRQLALEDQGVLLWAATDYESVQTQLESAEGQFRDGDFALAFTTYEEIIERLKDLEAMIPGELARQIDAGDAALHAGESEPAIQAFTIALAIEDSEEVQQKLARAENLEEVLQLVRQGEIHERNGELDDALAAFTSARDLDQRWKPASEGVTRIQSAIRQQRFQAAMSRAFQAVADSDYEAARKHFADAQSILPDSSEPADGLLQVEQAERNDAINAHRVEAEKLAAEDAWQEAIEAYEAALTISPSLEFAKSGLAYAKERLELDNSLQRFLADPTLLQSDEALDEATRTLRAASRIDDASDQLASNMDTLAHLISTARLEIPVTIYSDGRTNVTVRKHANLGKVTSQVIYLIPGRYTITGERSGYRDVREDLILIAGRPVPEVNIASTERVN